MVEMGCEEHDRQAASTQFITHTVGRVLGAMELQATPIDTRQAPPLLLRPSSPRRLFLCCFPLSESALVLSIGPNLRG